MNIEELRTYCLSFNKVTETFPFDEKTLVFKVLGKIFLLTNIDTFRSINIKCNPEEAIDLRERYNAVNPGYHMNKKHWNTVNINHDVNDNLLKEWIKNSYNLVIKGMPKKKQQEVLL